MLSRKMGISRNLGVPRTGNTHGRFVIDNRQTLIAWDINNSVRVPHVSKEWIRKFFLNRNKFGRRHVRPFHEAVKKRPITGVKRTICPKPLGINRARRMDP